MASLTFIARAHDGLLLTASLDASGKDEFTTQAKMILGRLSYESSRPSKCSIATLNDMVFHYVIDQGVCFMTLTHASYDKRLAFGFLEDIKTSFMASVEADDPERRIYRQIIDTCDRPYAFIQFDKVIQSKRREYSNPSSSRNMQRLQNELTDITNIMRKNIDDVLTRGEKLSSVSGASANLLSKSKAFEKNAKWLELWKKYQSFAALAACVLFCIMIIYWRLA